ncbi:MAG: hypothetical protein J6X28_03485 [Bacilli bacterium]|nr:hypothetical protein [Bacilli bacterium]
MVDAMEIQELDDETLLDLYQQVVDHIHFLDSSIIEVIEETEDEEGDSDE